MGHGEPRVPEHVFGQLAQMQHQVWQAEDRVAALEREQRQHMDRIAELEGELEWQAERTGDVAESDAARALAVLDRLVRDDATYVIEMHLTKDGDAMRVIMWRRDGREAPYGDGCTPAAALLALGARLAEGGDGGE